MLKDSVKKWCILMFLLVMGLTFSPTLGEANNVNVYLDSLDLKTDPDVSLVDLDNISSRLQMVKDDQGNLYFCLDESKYYPEQNGTNYYPGELLEKRELTWLLENFYNDGQFIGAPNAKTKYAATQIAIWSFTNPDRVPYSGDVVQNNPLIKDLIDRAKTFANLPTVREEFERIEADLQLIETKNPNSIPRDNPTYNVSVNVRNQSNSIKTTIDDVRVFMVEKNGTKTDLTTNPNVTLDFNNTTGQGTFEIERDYYNALPAGAVIRLEGSIELETEESLFLIYVTDNSSYQPLGSVFQQKLRKTIPLVNQFEVKALVDIEGVKTWDDENNQDGMRPESITIQLYANDQLQDELIVTAEANWSYQFLNLPKYDANDIRINYRLYEKDVEGYEATWNGWNVTNSYIPSEVIIIIEKQWEDDNDIANLRPDEILVQLLADGEIIEEIVLSQNNNWMYISEGLPKYANGQLIEYTVIEVTEVEHYISSIASIDPYTFTITNTYIYDEEEPPNSDVENESGNQNNITKLPQTDGHFINISFLGFLLLICTWCIWKIRRLNRA